MCKIKFFQGVAKRVETQNREPRGNNIYLRAGKRALYPPIMASNAPNLGPDLASNFGPYLVSNLGPFLINSKIRCLEGDTSSENDNRCIWSNGRFKNVNLLSLKGNSNGSSRWKWAPDLAIFFLINCTIKGATNDQFYLYLNLCNVLYKNNKNHA